MLTNQLKQCSNSVPNLWGKFTFIPLVSPLAYWICIWRIGCSKSLPNVGQSAQVAFQLCSKSWNLCNITNLGSGNPWKCVYRSWLGRSSMNGYPQVNLLVLLHVKSLLKWKLQKFSWRHHTMTKDQLVEASYHDKRPACTSWFMNSSDRSIIPWLNTSLWILIHEWFS